VRDVLDFLPLLLVVRGVLLVIGVGGEGVVVEGDLAMLLEGGGDAGR
jgi:hypothetical protein